MTPSRAAPTLGHAVRLRLHRVLRDGRHRRPLHRRRGGRLPRVGGAAANALLDRAPEAVHAAAVLAKRRSQGRYSDTLYVTLAPWRPGGGPETFEVGEDLFRGAHPRLSTALVVTRPGR
ncbi:MAG: hypothetical protein KGL53_13680, partial [Elusimicrobia bacterium]|nr:hypothetical protein [Elusimicrobiota bacterium]